MSEKYEKNQKMPDLKNLSRDELAYYLRPQWGWRSSLSALSCFFVFAYIYVDLQLDLGDLFSDGPRYIVDIVGRMLPPDFSDFDVLMTAMIETVEIAMMGTLLAILLSVPFGALSAKNISKNLLIYNASRTITVFFRALPEFIVAMLLVIAIGFGPMAGIIALGFHTMGFLAKFYAESIEHIDEEPLRALRVMGASKWQVFAFGVVPQILPSFLGNNFYILDRNVRMATMLGIVGAGGIGYELQSSFRMFQYERVSAIIILIFFTIFIIDKLSSYLRTKILDPSG